MSRCPRQVGLLLLVLSISWLSAASQQNAPVDTLDSLLANVTANLDQVVSMQQQQCSAISKQLADAVSTQQQQCSALSKQLAEVRAALQTAEKKSHNSCPDNTTSSVDTLPKKCLDGWTKVGGNCYIVSDAWAIWEDAETACSQLANGGHLGSIHADSKTEIYAILRASGQDYVWTGLKQSGGSATPNNFAWSDGTEVDFTDWGPRWLDVINDGNVVGRDDCGFWESVHGQWGLWPCSAGPQYLCQVQAA